MNSSIFKVLIFWTVIGYVVGQFSVKQGDCPPPVEVRICSITCRVDDHCNGISKCCTTACGGAICIRPVTARKPTHLAVKRGVCPVSPIGPWVCTSRCAYDGDCRGTKKCCKNRCGAMACMKPEE